MTKVVIGFQWKPCRASHTGRLKHEGYTLIELMLVVALAAILLAVVVPSFQTQNRNAQINAASKDLLSTLASARAEAIARTNFVTVCKRNSDATGCEADGGWELGWISFVDADGDGTVDGGDELIQIHEPLAVELTARGTSQIANRITYRPNGHTSLTATQTIILCDGRGFGVHAKGLVVTLLGKVSSLLATETSATDCQTS